MSKLGRPRKLNEEQTAFPQETARAAVAECVRAVQKGVRALSKSIDQGKASEIAKNIKFCMDTGDKLKRLADFAAGKPDSRPDMGLDALFAKLTTEQALELKRWLTLKSGTMLTPALGEARNGDLNGNCVTILPTISSLTPDFV